MTAVLLVRLWTRIPGNGKEGSSRTDPQAGPWLARSAMLAEFTSGRDRLARCQWRRSDARDAYPVV